MHTGTVVVEDWLRHEGGRFAVIVGNHVDDILVNLHAVGDAGQRIELETQFMLRRCHFVVMLLHLQAHFGHRGDHLRP